MAHNAEEPPHLDTRAQCLVHGDSARGRVDIDAEFGQAHALDNRYAADGDQQRVPGDRDWLTAYVGREHMSSRRRLAIRLNA